jgi:hypothetical protein
LLVFKEGEKAETAEAVSKITRKRIMAKSETFLFSKEQRMIWIELDAN